MVKQEKRYGNVSFRDLASAIEAVVGQFKGQGWRVLSKEETGSDTVWSVYVRVPITRSGQLFDMLTHLIARGQDKKLSIRVSGDKVSVWCKEGAPGLYFDTSGEKKKIVEQFFAELDRLLAQG